jgi:chromosome segregation ATPase
MGYFKKIPQKHNNSLPSLCSLRYHNDMRWRLTSMGGTHMKWINGIIAGAVMSSAAVASDTTRDMVGKINEIQAQVNNASLELGRLAEKLRDLLKAVCGDPYGLSSTEPEKQDRVRALEKKGSELKDTLDDLKKKIQALAKQRENQDDKKQTLESDNNKTPRDHSEPNEKQSKSKKDKEDGKNESQDKSDVSKPEAERNKSEKDSKRNGESQNDEPSNETAELKKKAESTQLAIAELIKMIGSVESASGSDENRESKSAANPKSEDKTSPRNADNDGKPNEETSVGNTEKDPADPIKNAEEAINRAEQSK